MPLKHQDTKRHKYFECNNMLFAQPFAYVSWWQKKISGPTTMLLSQIYGYVA
jgi:hypothetical protein